MNGRTAYGRTQNTLNAGVALGTTSTYSTTAATVGTINGRFVTALAVQTNAASPTLDAMTGLAFVPMAANRATVLVIGTNAAGVIQMAQGGVEDTEAGVGLVAGAFRRAPQFPVLPDNFMALGFVLVRTAPGAAAFTAGTSAWTAAGVTAGAVVNIATLPDRPVTS